MRRNARDGLYKLRKKRRQQSCRRLRMHLQEDAGFAAAGEHRVGDALGGLSVEAAALGLYHPAAPVIVGQQGQGAVGDGTGIAGGGPAVGGKERLVAGLAAAHQIRQQHGDALAGGLGDADAAGLGHQAGRRCPYTGPRGR